MAGQFLHGITENMHHLANQTRANIDQMAGTKQAMTGHVEAMGSQWLGAGSNACQQGHGVWDGSTTTRVLHPGMQMGDNVTTAGNLYDNVDQSAMSTMAGVGAAINPSA
jgi:uncharacterized protein YukE